MRTRVQLTCGDMFDGPSDVIVLPCSTAGTVTPFVQKRLMAFKLPHPRFGMKLGEVDFQTVSIELQQLAAFVGFAASVDNYDSNLPAIEAIGESLGEFAAATPAVSHFSAPLLGAGAGGLGPADVVARLAKGFMRCAPERATLKLFVLEQDAFEKLQADWQKAPGDHAGEETTGDAPQDDFPNIRVFVSYTKTTELHRLWVKGLATYLRENGIDARLDQWHLSPGSDVAQWMCNEVDMADRVLIVCNDEYARRADGRHGGVGWETRIIQGYLLQEGDNNPDKFIPLVRTSLYNDGLPAYLRTSYFLHWPESKGDDVGSREELLRALYKVTEQAPPIGRPPAFLIEAVRARRLAR